MHGTPTSLHNPVCIVLSFSVSVSKLSCHFMRYGLIDWEVIECVKSSMCCLCPKHDKNLGKLQLRTHCLRKVQMPRKISRDWNITFSFKTHKTDGALQLVTLEWWEDTGGWGGKCDYRAFSSVAVVWLLPFCVGLLYHKRGSGEGIVVFSVSYQLRRKWFRLTVAGNWPAASRTLPVFCANVFISWNWHGSNAV